MKNSERIQESLENIQSLYKKIQESSIEIEKQKEIVKSVSYGWEEYCKKYNLSRPTLSKRRDLGLIPFVILGAEYRYLDVEI